MYVIALAAGALAGIIYGLLGVRSPAPPVVALIGLLGMLLGEQLVPVAKRLIAREPINIAWLKTECSTHVFGELPARAKSGSTPESEVRSKC